jgi:CopG family transcriptional regulator/antitoxin EndoAI
LNPGESFGGAVLVSSAQNTKRIMISLPNQLLEEVDGIVQQEKSNRSEFIRQAMRVYLMERKKRHIRESMQQGYMEMAKINLNIASEAFHVEEEADDTLDRLVSGV